MEIETNSARNLLTTAQIACGSSILWPIKLHHSINCQCIQCFSNRCKYCESGLRNVQLQSRLMLEALEAPLADSRAAAVNIMLISCIGRQAKSDFALAPIHKIII